MSLLKTSLRRLLFIPPVVIGVLVVIFLASRRPGAERVDAGERITLARVIPIETVDLVPRVLGYGNAEAGDVWRGVAQVSGRITEVHPRLEPGEIIPAHTVLLRIDATDYQLAIARIEAQLAELQVTEENARASQAIQQRSLDLSQGNLEDKRRLLEQGALSQASFDAEEQAMLALELQVQQLENTLNLIPSQRDQLNAQLQQANLDLSRTEIAPPFDVRIVSKAAEDGQFVNVGTLMVEGDLIARSEVPAQVSISHVRTLVQAAGLDSLPIDSDGMADLSVLDLTATVRLSSGDFRAEWNGRVDRFAPQIDPQTRTLGIVVAVDDSYRQAIPGERPPLVRGAHCEVEIRGRPIANAIVIPRSALHGDEVYLLNAENRLEARRVNVGFHQSNLTLITDGLTGGETLIVSDLIPAIEGMLIDSTVDNALLETLRDEATGVAPVR